MQFVTRQEDLQGLTNRLARVVFGDAERVGAQRVGGSYPSDPWDDWRKSARRGFGGGLLPKVGTQLFGGEDGGVHGGVPSGGSAVSGRPCRGRPCRGRWSASGRAGSAVPVVLVVWAFTRLIAAARSSWGRAVSAGRR